MRRVIELVMYVLHLLEFLIFPAFCTYCKALLSTRIALCYECKKNIQPISSTKIVVTQKYEMDVYAVGAYQDPLKKLVLAKMYQERVACYYMAQLMYEYMQSITITVDYIVPVPLHWTRYAKRGYNQSEEIAYYLSKWTNIPVAPLLKRMKRTALQASCDKEGRRENVKDAFTITVTDDQKKLFQHKRFLFVDDVMTTGATLQSASRALLQLKPVAIKAILAARAC